MEDEDNMNGEKKYIYRPNKKFWEFIHPIEMVLHF
jgi:hypothetical protein